MTLRRGFTLGSWKIHPLEGTLIDGDTIKRVQPKSMDVLLALAERAPNVVERDALLTQVWGERAVSDEPLTRCIGELRRTLGDTRSGPEYILTVPKRGYRLLKPVVIDDSNGESADAVVLTEPQLKKRMNTVKKIAFGVAVLFAAALVEVFLERALEDASDSLDNGDSTVVEAVTAPHLSIVVLPFANISSDVEQEYFSDGISEELINLLTKIPDLHVTSRWSAFSYKGKNLDTPTIAAQLHVAHVLSGSVRKEGDQVRINVQLIDARNDAHLWSDTYERTLDNIFATQDEIAAVVVDQLKIQLQVAAPTVETTDGEAYALVLQARYLSRKLAPDALEKSITLYEQAVQLDPDYAVAWAGLAIEYANKAAQGLGSINEGYRQAREAANSALAIDPSYAPAHLSLARVALTYDRDLQAAARHYERALILEPANTGGIFGAASMLASLGRLEQAIELAEYAVARDPVFPIGHGNVGAHNLRAGHYDEAIESLRTTLVLAPGNISARYNIGTALLLKGQPEAALAETMLEQFEAWRLVGLVAVYHELGDTVASDAALAELIEKYEKGAAYNIANVLAFREEADRAFEWLQTAVNNNDPGLTFVSIDNLFAKIHADPRWLPFLESVGQSPEQLNSIKFQAPEIYERR
jgi:TolB-like protein/DNA-binding winged helix-turn-helix (wHTH) protein/Tfp pilus assembly protein PilF